MVVVFAIFATPRSLDMKELGVGLAIAVLIDATLVRAVLLPAMMKLLGDWNWYLPHWLQWLPSLSGEGAPVQAATHAPGVPRGPSQWPTSRRSSAGSSPRAVHKALRALLCGTVGCGGYFVKTARAWPPVVPVSS
jgi:hypothetical protein